MYPCCEVSASELREVVFDRVVLVVKEEEEDAIGSRRAEEE